MSSTGSSHLIVTRGSPVSLAPTHHTLPAFLNLHGIRFTSKTIIDYKTYSISYSLAAFRLTDLWYGKPGLYII